MEVLNGTIFVAWTNARMAYGPDEKAAVQELFSDGQDIELFRVACFALELPAIETTDGGTLVAAPDRPILKIVGGSDAS